MKPYGGPPLHPLAPCRECPFLRCNSYLRAARAHEIAASQLVEGGGVIFQCHKHLNRRRKDRPTCAGAILFAMKNGVYTQAMQIGERLGIYRIDRIRGITKVYDSLSAMVRGHDSDT